MYGYGGTWSKSEIWDKQKAHDKCQTVSPLSQVKTQESSFWSGILKWAFKTKICWLKYNRNKRVCNQIPSFFKRSFQVWFFLTGLDSVQWFSVPFWAVSNTIWVGCIESTEKSLFTCSVEVLPVSVQHICCCPAPAPHSSCFAQVDVRKGTSSPESREYHLVQGASVRSGRQASSLPVLLFNRTEHVKQSRLQAKT